MISPPSRVGIIGAGIVGLAVARQISEKWPGTQIAVFDKETEVGRHQTGRNSGVVHAGLYYKPGSLKARLCTRGRMLLTTYCRERGVDVEPVGKVVVATNHQELDRLADIFDRSLRNGVPGVSKIGRDELREIEPSVEGIAAVHSPETAIVDFRAVAEHLGRDLVGNGGTLELGRAVAAIDQTSDGVVVSDGVNETKFHHLFICAGLGGDRLAKMAGIEDQYRVIPFRGEYYRVEDSDRQLVRGLIYPVPDPSLPFLGIHLTRAVDGSVLIGPNAVLALAAEGYRWSDVSARSLWRTGTWPGFWSLARKHWRTGITEVVRSLSRSRFVAEAQRFVPSLQEAALEPAPAGVRAQVVSKKGDLADDFVISKRGAVTAVRNAPSPAATSSLAIAEYIVDQSF